jgi:squalene synthase HpnC
MSNSHYENFPVASPLLPPRLRAPVRVIYAFARSADDIADEGHASDAERLAALCLYQDELSRIEQGQPNKVALFTELGAVIRQHGLALRCFRDLLSAFAQDVVQTRYADFASLLDYCARSANPVGRIMLALFEEQDALSLQQSDAICSALQLINFWQDVAIDWEKSRVYLPAEDLLRFGVNEEQIAAAHIDDNWRALMQFEISRARQLMHSGLPLTKKLRGRMGWELRLIVQGGLRILDKIEAADYDVFIHRPTLEKRDWIIMLWRAIRNLG